MKERPIIFSGEMVRSILENRKTQTRRIAKIERIDDHPEKIGNDRFKIATLKNGKQYWMNEGNHHPYSILNVCPHGQIGDRLWVRETFLPRLHRDALYRADYDQCEAAGLAGMYSDKGWKSPIFMPRKLSRITLEITNIRVERLQQISDEDLIAEGVRLDLSMMREYHDERFCRYAAYRSLWEKINGKDSWDLNPWVFVIEFRRIDETPSC